MSAPVALQALSLVEAHARLGRGTLDVTGYADTLLAHASGCEPALHAFACLDPEHVRTEARALGLVHDTARGPLYGLGIGVKDIIGTADLPTRCGSQVAPEQRLDADATCVARLRAAGGYVFGKTVTTEFAFMHPGPTVNPWNPAHTPGGSSSGSAAAVARGIVPAALGTQTNGSVIRPAAFCGVVGFKPTRGALPFAGVHLFSATLDTLGTFTRTVADAARLASVLADAAGWVDVDQGSMRHKKFANIFSLGDAGSMPNAKTAAAARKQAPIVACNVLSDMKMLKGTATYDGYGSCPLTVERGKIVLAEFGYGGKLLPTFSPGVIDGLKPSRAAWFLKERVLPPVYWRAMLKGREWLAKPTIG